MFPSISKRQDTSGFEDMTPELVDIEMAAHGVSIVEIAREGDDWLVVLDSPYNRRISPGNTAGKPEGIHLMIGRRPYAAFGNSTGDQQMLEYTGAGAGARLKMLLLHDDAEREYAYGPAAGLPDTKVGTFTQELFDEAKRDGWIVISMKKDWKTIFSFEKPNP
jgi:hypothetical protein